MRFRTFLVAALALGLPIAGALAAQARSLRGRVLDAATGDPLPGARVLLLPTRLTEVADEEGLFVFRSLSPGFYRIEVDRIGYGGAVFGPFEPGPPGGEPLELLLDRLPIVERVVVTSSAPVPAGSAAPGDVAREEFFQIPGTLGDPMRGLTSVPGVAGVNDFKAEVRLRGGEPEDTLYRLDGVTIQNPYHFRWMRGSTAAVNPYAFDQFRVRSSAGPEVGDAVSGVIELVPTSRGKGGLFVEGALGTLASGVTAGGPSGEGSWVAGGRYSSLFIYKSLYNVERVSVPAFADLTARIRRPVSPDVEIVAGGLLFGNGLSTTDPQRTRSSKLDATAGNLYVGADATLPSGGGLSGRIAWSGSHQKVFTSEGDDLESRERRIAASLELSGGPESAAGPGWRLGVEGASLSGRIDGAIQTAGLLHALDEGSTRWSTWGSFTLRPLPRCTLEAGLRTDHDTRFGSAPVQPRVRFEYSDPRGWQGSLSAGRYAQFPRFEQEFLARGEPLGITTMDEVAAGVAFSLPLQMRAEIAVYERRLRDAVSETVNRLPDLPEPMGRFERARARGVELGLRRDRGRLRTAVSATFLASRQHRDGETSRRNGDEPWRLDATAAWLLGARWELLGRVQASSGLPFTGWEPAGGGARTLGPLNGERLPPYARLDLRISYDWDRGRSRGRVFFEIANALDRTNVRGRDLRWDDGKRRYYVKDDEAMPLLPGIGLEVTWGR